MTLKPFLPIIALYLFTTRAIAQNAPDTLFSNRTEIQVVNNYNKTIGDQSEIYNGPQYNLLPKAYKGSPYFLDTASVQPANIRYNGTWYNDIPILYDAYNDLMISVSHSFLYAVRSEKLSDVLLAGHHFIYLPESKDLKLASGYYDQLYEGQSQVLVKRKRGVVKRVDQQSVLIIYEMDDAIYIKKGADYLPVSSKQSVLGLFKNKSKQLKEYLSANKISFSKDKERSIAQLAAYYDQINH
ncbi:MAG TPA: hypothetical protein VL442_09325 [Mucilaginibacter sp.]|jgi:hypothetical protein|nr:hypothetical protein [Mucilaginibacter sp.]